MFLNDLWITCRLYTFFLLFLFARQAFVLNKIEAGHQLKLAMFGLFLLIFLNIENFKFLYQLFLGLHKA